MACPLPGRDASRLGVQGENNVAPKAMMGELPVSVSTEPNRDDAML